MRRSQANPHKPRTKLKWSPDDTTELLAHLDFIVEKRHQNGKFSKEVVLRKLQSSLKKRRTFRQIDARLFSIWNHCVDTDSRKKFQDVYRLGSGCMKSLDDGIKLKVRTALNVIKDNEISIRLSTPRQLRSSSRNPDVESTLPKPDQIISGVQGTPTKSVPTKRHRMLACQESDSNKHPVGKATTKQDALLVQDWKHPSRLINIPSDTSVADTEDCLEIHQSFDTYSEGRSDGLCNFDAVPSLQRTSQSFFYASQLQNAPALDYDDPDSIQQFFEKPILDHSHETLRDLFSDNTYFREKWSSSEKECKRLLHEERRTNSLLATLNDDFGVKTARIVKSQDDRIANLELQVSNQTFLRPFLTLARERHAPLNLEKVQSSFAQMKSRFRSLSIMNKFQYPRGDSIHHESEDVDELMRTVLGNVRRSALHDDATRQIGDQVPIGTMVQSLIGAAVCEWVFKAELRCTAMMNTPLLEKYRYHLRTVCGEVALRNLDFAAHQSVVNDEHFQDVFLCRTATKLADRLLDALHSFIKDNGRHQSGVRVKKHLESIFRNALNIKTQVIIGKDVFEIIWPARNSAFHSLSMIPEPPESAPDGLGVSERGPMTVKLPLIPGLRVYSYDRKLVDYCSFAKGGEEGLEEPNLVSEAVVAVEK